MPFDGLPADLVSDVVRLRVALDGVRTAWQCGEIGRDEHDHCALGWLLVATDWDRDAAVDLAIKYVYPALPASAQLKDGSSKLASIFTFNDDRGQKSVVRLFTQAVRLAEQRIMR